MHTLFGGNTFHTDDVFNDVHCDIAELIASEFRCLIQRKIVHEALHRVYLEKIIGVTPMTLLNCLDELVIMRLSPDEHSKENCEVQINGEWIHAR